MHLVARIIVILVWYKMFAGVPCIMQSFTLVMDMKFDPQKL